ncbi:hypothetical protein ACFSF2_04085 [Paenibacillus rhizophilus]|uniref:hypothetical protein n=1 Tax=Paenibacillus rhizophilus TaxID=1850366 RepID=UPI001C89C6E6
MLRAKCRPKFGAFHYYGRRYQSDEISSTEKNQLDDKNERRLDSIRGYREEVKDEARNQKNK